METPDLQYVPAEILPRLANLKAYMLVVLKKGTEYYSEEAKKIIQGEHLPYIFKLRDQGVLAISIPVYDENEIAGIAIYTVTDKEEVMLFCEADPGVQKGVFVYDVMNCAGLKGDALI